MKIHVNTKEFTHTLKSINWQGKPLEIILENALLVADDEGMRLFRTNLDLYVTINVPGEIQEPGSCLIPVKKVLAVFKNCKGEIPLEFDGNYLKVGNYLLDTMPADDYPQPELENYAAIGTTQGHVLAYAIEKTAPWLDHSGKTSLEHFCLKNGRLVTSESHTLCLAETGIHHDRQLLINKSLTLLDKVDLEGEVQVSISEKYFSLRGENFEAIIRLMDYQYPDFSAVIPTQGYPLKVDAEALVNGLKEAIAYSKALTKEKEIPIHLRWLEDRMEIFGLYGNDNKEFCKPISEMQREFPVSLALNAVRLLTAIKGLRGELTIWHPGDKRLPFVITDGKTFKYLQMPVTPDGCDDNTECKECLSRPKHCHPLPEDTPLQEIPYAPDLNAVPKPSKKARRKGTTKKATKSSKKASSGMELNDKALAELKARADFWEAETLKKEEHIRNLEAELAKLQESYKALLQFQALRPNGKGRYAYIDGRQYLFSQGKILDEDGNEVGHYNRKGGEIKGHHFKLQQEWVAALN